MFRFADVLPNIIIRNNGEKLFDKDKNKILEFNKCFILMFDEKELREYSNTIDGITKAYKTLPVFVIVFHDYDHYYEHGHLLGYHYPLILINMKKVSGMMIMKMMMIMMKKKMMMMKEAIVIVPC